MSLLQDRKRRVPTPFDPLQQLTRIGDPRLEHLASYVSTNLCRRLSLAQAAEIVGLERTHFSRMFRHQTGYTFSEWNRSVRIERAKVLLRRRGIKIVTIAFSVGYRDLTTFERAFKKCSGMSPRAYRYGQQINGFESK